MTNPARELRALGHDVRLMPPQYVKAYVKRNKNDAADAEAVCEAVRRPSMRFVPVKTVEQQSALLMHRGRELLVRQRTMLANALRGHLGEFGLIVAQGLHNVAGLIAIVRDDEDECVPDIPRQVLRLLADQIDALSRRIAAIEAQIMTWHNVSGDFDPGKLITSRSAEPIRASGPYPTASTARTPDRKRPSPRYKFLAGRGHPHMRHYTTPCARFPPRAIRRRAALWEPFGRGELARVRNLRRGPVDAQRCWFTSERFSLACRPRGLFQMILNAIATLRPLPPTRC